MVATMSIEEATDADILLAFSKCCAGPCNPAIVVWIT
jgi:hypothetical protein